MNIIIGGFKFTEPEDEEGPFVVQEVMCVRCLKRWIAVAYEETLLKDYECPQCHQQGFVIATGQIIRDSDIESEDEDADND